MTTLSAARTRAITHNHTNAFPILTTSRIWAGAAVGLVRATGKARALQAGDTFVGFAQSSVNHIHGEQRDTVVTVLDCGQTLLAITGALETDVGKDVYATDDDTFTLSSSGGSFVGVAKLFVSAGKLLVEVSPPSDLNAVRLASSGAALVSGDGYSLLSGGVLLRKPSGMKRAAIALSRAEYSIARVACLGDSVTLGTYSNDSSIPVDSVADNQGFVGRLRAMLARKYGATEAGYIAANDSRNTLSGTGAVTSSVGPIINTVRTDNTTTLGGALPLPSAATITIPVPACTTIEVLYLDSNTNSVAGAIGANTGSWSWNVDAAGATTVSADNVNPINYKKTIISGLSNAAQSLVLTGVSGTSYIYGIVYYGASGVVVSRLGLGGATCLDLTGEGTVTHLATGATQRIFGVYSSPVAPAVFTGATVSGSTVVTGISSTTGIVAGMPVGANAGMALPCFVESVDSATQITLTNAATATNAARTMYIGAGTTLTADLWVIPIGHNDWQKQNDTYPTPLPIFTAQMQRVIDQLVAAGGCVLLVGEPKSNTAAPSPETYPIETYWAALETLADTNEHVSCLQINRQWGAFADSESDGFQSAAGGVHPLRLGHANMATILFTAIDAAVSR